MTHLLAAFLRRNSSHTYVCLLAVCLLTAFAAHARDTAAVANDPQSPNAATGPLSIKVYDDRMTVEVAGAPQVFLYGSIDADTPHRFADLVQSHKIVNGSDVYLNATGSDIDAGIALGRLLRASGVSTHLGRPTRTKRAKMGDKSSICTGACAYAYLGGVYRWAASGRDRFGLAATPSVDPKSADATAAAERIDTYLKDMGVAATAVTAARGDSHDPVAWVATDQMISSGLANNGRQPLVANYRLDAGTPSLELNRVGRHGEQRLTLQCKPGSIALTAYNTVGANHAQQIIRHAARSYLEVDQKETLMQASGGASIDRDTLIVERAYPPSQLQSLLSAKSVGAWINQQNSPLRYGFAFGLYGINRTLSAFQTACAKTAQMPAKPKV